jgi:hypothetical protein
MFLGSAMLSKTKTLLLVMALLALALSLSCKDSTDPAEPETIIGSWGTGYSPDPEYPEDYASLTFYPNGYLILWISDNESSASDSGGGVEIGTYNYDTDTQIATVNIMVDENGDWGLAENGVCDFEFSVENNTLYAYEPNDEEPIEVARVESNTNPLVGGWGIARYTDTFPEYVSMTFYANGLFILWLSDDPEDDGASAGAEVGTYSFNSQTGALTLNTCFLDENGTDGFFENGEPGDWGSGITCTIDNDNVTFYINGEEEWSGPRVQ